MFYVVTISAYSSKLLLLNFRRLEIASNLHQQLQLQQIYITFVPHLKHLLSALTHVLIKPHND